MDMVSAGNMAPQLVWDRAWEGLQGRSQAFVTVASPTRC